MFDWKVILIWKVLVADIFFCLHIFHLGLKSCHSSTVSHIYILFPFLLVRTHMHKNPVYMPLHMVLTDPGGLVIIVTLTKHENVYKPHLSTAVAWREKKCKHFVFNKYFSLVLELLKSRISEKNNRAPFEQTPWPIKSDCR